MVSDVLDRSRVSKTRSTTPEIEVVAPLWARGAFAALWSTAVGLAVLVVVALIVWAADSNSGASAGSAMRFAADLWLAAHRTPLELPDGTIALAPLGLTLLLGLVLARATAIVARSSGEGTEVSIGAVAASVSLPYAILATILAAIGHTGDLKPTVGASFITAALFAAAVTTIGALRGAGLAGETWERVPTEIRIGLRAAGRATAVLLAGATVLTLGSVIAHAGAIGDTFNNYQSGPGKLAVASISVLLAPNAILCSAAYLTGAGFAVGTGTSVTMAHSHVGAMPALPIFAAVPHGRAPAYVIVLAVIVVIGAGAVAAWPASANRPPVADQLRTVGYAAAALLFGSLVIGALTGGPAGPGTLAAVGPSPWKAGLLLTAVTSLVSLLVVAGHAWTGQARAMLANRT